VSLLRIRTVVVIPFAGAIYDNGSRSIGRCVPGSLVPLRDAVCCCGSIQTSPRRGRTRKLSDVGGGSSHRDTSIKQRLDHIDAQDATIRLAAAKEGSVAGSRAAVGLEDSLWLCPIEDRRGLDSTREGMLQGFSLGSYVPLVDYTGQHFRQSKASISAELAGIFERIGCSAQSWQSRMEKLRDGRLLGRFFATTRAKLREIAERLGMRWPVNVVGYPV
jgi:hypothetical protein